MTRLIGQRAELREKVSEKDTEIAQLRAENELLKQSDNKGASGAPKWEDFQDEDEYRAAVAKWSSRNNDQSSATRDPAAVFNQFRQQEQFDRKVQDHYQKAEALAEKFPDYSQAEEAAIQALGQGLVNDITQHSDKSAELMLYFGRNPHEAQRFKTLSASNPVGASIELGRLEARLNVQPKQSSQAPEPDEPLDGGSGPTVSASKYEKQLDELRAKGDVAGAIALKRRAQSEGVYLE